MRILGRTFLICTLTAISMSAATLAAELSSPNLDVLSYAAGERTWAGDLTVELCALGFFVLLAFFFAHRCRKA